MLPLLGRAVREGSVAERLDGKPVEPIFGGRPRSSASGPNVAARKTSRLGSVHTDTFCPLLEQLQSSLLVTTGQAGKLVLLRADPECGSVNTHFVDFAEPAGLAARPGQIAIGTAHGIFELHNVPAVARKLEPAGRFDACYLPRGGHVTGQIAIAEMAYAEEELWFVNTRFSCLCVSDGEHSFVPRWRPPFVSRLTPEDRCHLSGLGLAGGRLRYVTALGETDTVAGWRKEKQHGGIVLDVESGEVIARGLACPHSPRWHAGRLWVLDSGRGSLGHVDLESGRYEPIVELPGFTRGLDFAGNLAFVGLSRLRASAVAAGIPVAKRHKPEESRCGVWVVDIGRGQIVAFLEFAGNIREVFAVALLPGMRYPQLTGDDAALIGNSFVLPEDALRQVPETLRSGEARRV